MSEIAGAVPLRRTDFRRYFGHKRRAKITTETNVVSEIGVSRLERCDSLYFQIGYVFFGSGAKNAKRRHTIFADRLLDRIVPFSGTSAMISKAPRRALRQADIFFPVRKIEAIEVDRRGHHPGSYKADGVKGGASATNTAPSGRYGMCG
jgi:hypothetical protein